jgi:MarR family transcriptional regulator for hemolysin
MQRSARRELIAAIIETSRHLRNFIDLKARQHGLTGAQLRVLAWLRRQEGVTQSGLAAELEMRPMSAGGLVDKLVGHDLVDRRRDGIDRRVNRLYLTPAGREVARRLDGFRETVVREVLADIDDPAVEAALDTLLRLKRRLSEQAGDGAQRTQPSPENIKAGSPRL